MRTQTIRFQSTPSAGRATKLAQSMQTMANISIHALRGEGDYTVVLDVKAVVDFNPRPPRGGRRRQSGI